jgi:phosphate transport system permease protein
MSDVSPPSANSSSNHSNQRQSSRYLGERFFNYFSLLCGLLILLVMAAIVVVLIRESLPFFERAREFEFFTSSKWDPNPVSGTPTFGSLNFLWGTFVTSAISLLIAVPLGVATAAFLAEVAPAWLRRIGAFLIELLAAIPSVVYGFWGIVFIQPAMEKIFLLVGATNTTGKGLLTAGIVLAIMILPYITAISFDACRSVPRSQREGALALGATRWQMIWSVVLPYARPGIIAACFLALGRALGETMAVTMLIGISDRLSFALWATGDSIPSRIANQLPGTFNETQRMALIALGVLLLFMTGLVNILAKYLLTKLGKPRIRKPTHPPTNEFQTASGVYPALHTDVLESNIKRARRRNRTMIGVLFTCFILCVIPLFLILGYIGIWGIEGLSGSLFNLDAKTEDPQNSGLGHAMIGSAIMVLMATVLATPIGLFAAVYLAESRNSRLANIIRFVTELLSGVPSIIIGVFIYIIAVKSGVFGLSAWAGAIALAIMMIPIVVRSAEESLRVVPDSIRQASYALGATRTQTVFRVIVPAALPAIVTGVFLAIGRIAGETAPLLLTAGNYNRFTTDLGEPMPFLPYYIYDYSTSKPEVWLSQAWGAAFVLLFVIMILNIGIRFLAGNRVIAASRAD